MPNLQSDLLEKIRSRQALVAVIGLGYVGLPLALTFADKGFEVLGLDVDQRKVEALGRGDCYIRHLETDRTRRILRSARFLASAEFSSLHKVDVILICVPTPLTPHREPDMTYVEATAREVRDNLRQGQLVVLESTTYPGTTDELLRDILEQTGLRSGEDFFLAFSPEREDPGNASYGTSTIPKVVGGVDPISGDLAQALYDEALVGTVRVSSARVAEATKLTENVFRAVNIALVNELKVIYDRMGVDIWEVLEAAETKPFGFMRFNPGPGWGGHCIPVDPFYLAWKAREYGEVQRFIELAGVVNVEMPRYVVEKLQRALNHRGKPLQGSRVLLVGLAYKRDTDDPRESPAFEIIHQLLELEARVSYHDPHIPEAPRMRTWPLLPPLLSQPLTEAVVRSQDAVVIVTDHRAIDYGSLLEHAALVVDTRGVYRQACDKVVRA